MARAPDAKPFDLDVLAGILTAALVYRGR